MALVIWTGRDKYGGTRKCRGWLETVLVVPNSKSWLFGVVWETLTDPW